MRGLFRLFADFSANSETLRGLRNQSHITALCMLVFVCLGAGTSYLFAPIHNNAAQQIIFIVLFTLAALYCASLIAAKYTDISNATGYFSTLWTAVIVLFLCCISGGVAYSDASPLILAPITMAFCFLGLRAGIIISALVLTCFIGLGYLSLAVFKFPDLLEAKVVSLNQMVVWAACFTVLLGVLNAYEWMITKLLNRRGGSESSLHKEYTGEKQYHIVSREHFEHFLHEAEQRCIQYEDCLVLCSLHLPASPPEVIVRCMQEIQSLLRNIDTLVRTGEYTISFTLENITSAKSAEYFIECIGQHLERCELVASEDKLKLSHACMPGPCNSWQDLVRSTKPYYSQTNLSAALLKSGPYASA